MEIYDGKEQQYGDQLMRELERVVLLKTVDRYWMDHIDNMDELRKGIHLRAYGQKDPVVMYRIEGFDMFDQMIAAIREDTVPFDADGAASAPRRSPSGSRWPSPPPPPLTAPTRPGRCAKPPRRR